LLTINSSYSVRRNSNNSYANEVINTIFFQNNNARLEFMINYGDELVKHFRKNKKKSITIHHFSFHSYITQEENPSRDMMKSLLIL